MNRTRTKLTVAIVLFFVVSFSVGLALYSLKSKSSPSPTLAPSQIPAKTQAPFVVHTLSPDEISPITELEVLFDDPQCAVPCWQEITPGETTIDEALQLLKQSPLLVSREFTPHEFKGGYTVLDFTWRINDASPEEKANLNIGNGVVFEISSSLSNLTIEEIIDRFGLPQKVDATVVSVGIPADQHLSIALLYPEKGFEIFKNDYPTSGDAEVRPSDQISAITIFPPSSLEDWLASRFGDPSAVVLSDWEGYGDLVDLYLR